MRVLIFTLMLVCVAYTALDEDWKNFKLMYNKVYNSTDETKRRAIWEENKKKIEEHNAEFKKGLQTYALGENKFADMTFDEFAKQKLGLRVGNLKFKRYHQTSNVTQVPSAYDIRTKGLVGYIKDQQDCGCCWAFATAAAVEALHARLTGQFVSLSDQQLNDCAKGTSTLPNGGCNGGYLEPTYENIASMGLMSEASYPYTARDDICNYDARYVVASISGSTGVLRETDIRDAVAKNNAVSIAVYASPNFQLYKFGIYKPTRSENLATVNHAVTVIGYDLRSSNPYWIIRNSWGTSWGEQGFMRLQYGVDALSIIRSTMACYPYVNA